MRSDPSTAGAQSAVRELRLSMSDNGELPLEDCYQDIANTFSATLASLGMPTVAVNTVAPVLAPITVPPLSPA